MIQVVALTALFVVVALGTVTRLWIPVAAALCLYVLIPMAASTSILGGFPLGFHLAGLLVGSVAVVQVAFRARDYLVDLARAPWVTAVLGAFVVAALATTELGGTGSGPGLVVNQILLPLVLFGLVRRALADDAGSARRFVVVVLALAVVQSVTALLTIFGVIAQPWGVPDVQVAITSDESLRARGLTDHPLSLGVFLAVAVALATRLRSLPLQLALIALFIGGILTAQSRTALVLALACLVIRVFRRDLSARLRLFWLSSLAVVAIGLFVTPLAGDTVQKFVSDGGSGAARTSTLPLGLEVMSHHLFVGGGTFASSRTAAENLLPTSFENPFVMYGIDYGTVFAVAYFAAMFVVVLRTGRRAVDGGRLAGLVAVLAILTFSSLGTHSTIGATMWFALALGSVALPPRKSSSHAAEARVAPGCAVPAAR